MFYFIIFFFKDKSDMGEIKAVLVSLPLLLLIAATFWIYQARTENKVIKWDTIAESKVKVLAKTRTRRID